MQVNDKIAELKNRIDNGFYNKEKFLDLERTLSLYPDLADEETKDILRHNQKYDKFGSIAGALAYMAFRKDVGDALGLLNHKKYELMFNIAWEKMYAYGLSAVLDYALTLAQLLQDDNGGSANG
jgi:hypothetical protein